MADGHILYRHGAFVKCRTGFPTGAKGMYIHIRFYFEDSGYNRCNSQGNRFSLLHRGF